jgi:hypothetical protein
VQKAFICSDMKCPFCPPQHKEMICGTNANDILHSLSRHVSLQQEQHLQLEHGWLLQDNNISLCSDTKLSTVVGN